MDIFLFGRLDWIEKRLSCSIRKEPLHSVTSMVELSFVVVAFLLSRGFSGHGVVLGYCSLNFPWLQKYLNAVEILSLNGRRNVLQLPLDDVGQPSFCLETPRTKIDISD